MRACALLGELLELFGREYELLKGRRGAVDFDDLELGAGALLDEHENVRGAWAERFELMMVDEFQDTNPRQLAILRRWSAGTCSRWAMSSSRSMAFATPTSPCSAPAATSSPSMAAVSR